MNTPSFIATCSSKAIDFEQNVFLGLVLLSFFIVYALFLPALDSRAGFPNWRHAGLVLFGPSSFLSKKNKKLFFFHGWT
jgi:hypothetical protein